MTIFLILAPFGAFAFLPLIASTSVSLFASAAVCPLAVIGFDVISGRSIRFFGAGCVGLFTGLGAYVTLIDPGMSVAAVGLDGRYRCAPDLAGFADHPQAVRDAICARGRRCRVPKLDGFRRATYIITWACKGAFLLMIVGNILTIYIPGLPLWSGLVIAFAARNSAAYFTTWYPRYCKAKYGPAGATSGVLAGS